MGPMVLLSIVIHYSSMLIESFELRTNCLSHTLGWSQEKHQQTNWLLSSKPSRL